MEEKKKMKKVQVLLSAYNGEKYLAAQINSILAQKNVVISLLIRDDGSEDATPALLAGYAGRYDNICVYYGKNIGTQKSYFDLLQHADTDQDYYAFSDQDDIWLPNKLERAVEVLAHTEASSAYGRSAGIYSGKYAQNPGRVLLYASNVIYASEDLHIRKWVRRRIRKPPSFGNALVENLCMGCTEVFHASLLERIKNHPPDCGIFHDWWVYLTAAYFGEVVFDSHAYILYRQHKHNQVGMPNSRIQKWKKRIGGFYHLHGLVSRQADNFADIYGIVQTKRTLLDHADIMNKNMQAKQQELELAAGYRRDLKKRWKIVFDGAVYRQGCLDQFIYKILFALGYL